MVIGNILAAVLLQTSLQVYVHERQLTSGAFLIVALILEAAYLIWRGLYFNLVQVPDPLFLTILLTAFLFGTLLVLIGSLGAIYIGNRKRIQMNRAMDQLNLSTKRALDEL